MKIYIRRSGGVANIPLEGEVDTKDLPVDLRKKAETLLRLDKLRALSASKGRKLPDTYQYEIRVAEGDTFEALTLDEGAMEDEIQELLSNMIAVFKKKNRSKPAEGRP